MIYGPTIVRGPNIYKPHLDINYGADWATKGLNDRDHKNLVFLNENQTQKFKIDDFEPLLPKFELIKRQID